MTASPSIPRTARLASRILAVIALLVAIGAAYIVIVPINATNFEVATGLAWEEFSSANPEAGAYLTREARILSVGYLTLGLVAAIVAWKPLRGGDRWAGYALWVFSVGILAASLVFFAADDTVLGATYLAIAVVSAAAVTVARQAKPERT